MSRAFRGTSQLTTGPCVGTGEEHGEREERKERRGPASAAAPTGWPPARGEPHPRTDPGAARECFAERGYDAASVRRIAETAGVDQALVHHFYARKEKLFLNALQIPWRMPEPLAEAAVGDRVGLGSRIVLAHLQVWEDASARPAMTTTLRSAATHRSAAAVLRDYATGPTDPRGAGKGHHGRGRRTPDRPDRHHPDRPLPHPPPGPPRPGGPGGLTGAMFHVKHRARTGRTGHVARRTPPGRISRAYPGRRTGR